MGLAKTLHAEFVDATSVTVQRLAEIAGRTTGEILSDAVRLYVWVAYEQWRKRHVISVASVNGSDSSNAEANGHDVVEVDCLVKDKAAADAFFKDLDWSR